MALITGPAVVIDFTMTPIATSAHALMAPRIERCGNPDCPAHEEVVIVQAMDVTGALTTIRYTKESFLLLLGSATKFATEVMPGDLMETYDKLNDSGQVDTTIIDQRDDPTA